MPTSKQHDFDYVHSLSTVPSVGLYRRSAVISQNVMSSKQIVLELSDCVIWTIPCMYMSMHMYPMWV